MVKPSSKRAVVRAESFSIPSKISAEQFAEICEAFNILPKQRDNAKARLDTLVTAFAEWMTGEKLQPDRSTDRGRLREALSHIKGAEAPIGKLGPSGNKALKVVSDVMAPMVSGKWINESFPGDDYAPLRSQPQDRGRPRRMGIRGEDYFIEEDTLEARYLFVSYRAAKTITAVLKTIEAGLSDALRVLDLQPGSRGGRTPLRYRHYLIINLAEMWSELGKGISTGPGSDFAAFCEVIAEYIGWPSDGMSAAIPKALKDWRNLALKIR